jgi:hypothetical protein
VLDLELDTFATTGVAGGYEFSFAVLPITENVPNGAVIEELFEE